MTPCDRCGQPTTDVFCDTCVDEMNQLLDERGREWWEETA